MELPNKKRKRSIKMGLTKQSVGMGAVDSGLEIKKQTPDDKIIAGRFRRKSWFVHKEFP